MSPRQSKKSNSLRRQRKNQHLDLVLELHDGPVDSGFNNIQLIPEALPELSLADIDISTTFCGFDLSAPLMINAMTGGTPRSATINAQLSQVAQHTGLMLAVGSQRIALDDPLTRYSFSIARAVNQEGIIWANLSAGSSVDDARRAVDMIGAQGLQLHLNAAQELFMKEGDLSFYWAAKMKSITEKIQIPVIAKEVGCGMSGMTAKRLLELGASAIDLGGAGGTNFIAIENHRNKTPDVSFSFERWGLPTVLSLYDVKMLNPLAEICASGGIRGGLDMAKAISMGARICAIARPMLEAIIQGGVKGGIRLAQDYLKGLRLAMLLVGAKDLISLQERSYIFRGNCM